MYPVDFGASCCVKVAFDNRQAVSRLVNTNIEIGFLCDATGKIPVSLPHKLDAETFAQGVFEGLEMAR